MEVNTTTNDKVYSLELKLVTRICTSMNQGAMTRCSSHGVSTYMPGNSKYM